MAELKEKIHVKRADEAELIEKAHLADGKNPRHHEKLL